MIMILGLSSDSSLSDDGLNDSFVDFKSEVSDNEMESHLEVASAAPSFSLLSHSESSMTSEDALPMSAEFSSASDDDMLVSDSLTSIDVSEADLSDLVVSSDSSDSQSDSQVDLSSEVSSSHSYKFHPRSKSNSHSDD